MSRSSLRIDDALEAYLTKLLPEEPAVLARLREETSRLEAAAMQIGRDQGRMMTVLLGCLGAQRTIEVGVPNHFLRSPDKTPNAIIQKKSFIMGASHSPRRRRSRSR